MCLSLCKRYDSFVLTLKVKNPRTLVVVPLLVTFWGLKYRSVWQQKPMLSAPYQSLVLGWGNSWFKRKINYCRNVNPHVYPFSPLREKRLPKHISNQYTIHSFRVPTMCQVCAKDFEHIFCTLGMQQVWLVLSLRSPFEASLIPTSFPCI